MDTKIHFKGALQQFYTYYSACEKKMSLSHWAWDFKFVTESLCELRGLSLKDVDIYPVGSA